MLSEILLYVDLLVFLAGTLIYGYLAREVLFRPSILPGNRAIRAGLLALGFFYLATLIDEQFFLLLGHAGQSAAGTFWDLLRAAAWLVVFPLVVETLAFALKVSGRPPSPWLARLGWLTLLPFLHPAWAFFRAQSPMLAEATAVVYPWVVLHATLNLAVAGRFAGLLAELLASARAMARLLTGMQAVFWGLAIFFLASYGIDPWGAPRPEARTAQLVGRTAVMASLLLPGFLIAVFVRRDQVLRLSLSFRTLRHFLSVLVLVALVMAAGPALGVGNVELYRRTVAWGLFLALFAGTLYRPVADALFRRFQPLRRLMGRDLAAAELEDLVDRLVASDLAEPELMALAARELSERLAVDARFLRPAEEDRRTALFWKHFGDGTGDPSDASSPPRKAVHRLDPGDAQLAAVLAREELQAVFPVRVDGQLAALLAVSVADVSPFAGGLDEGELEVVSLLVRQLSALLGSRRRLETRLAEERRLAEQERLGLLGLVAASLAHEVKNPLSSMKVLAQALREDLQQSDPDGDGVADLEAIVEQIDRLSQTTREILGVARPKASERCDLSDLVRGAMYIIGADAKRRGVTLEGDVQEVGEVPGSPASWQTVVFNLVLNAVHHAPAGETVGVQLTRSADDLAWRFEVTNPVVDAEDSVEVDRWFEPFVTEGGTGLGLALVARRAEELGVAADGCIEGGLARFKVEGKL